MGIWVLGAAPWMYIRDHPFKARRVSPFTLFFSAVTGGARGGPAYRGTAYRGTSLDITCPSPHSIPMWLSA